MSYDFSGFQAKAQSTLQHIQADIGTLRTGRASVQLLDPVMVEAYGTRMKLNEVANVAAPDPTLLTISPWDKSLVSTIEKAITISGLNLQPVVDGQMIRVPVPPLTEERRKEMVKLLQQKIESGRVMMRNVRGDARKEIEDMQGQPGVSEDSIKADLEQLDKKMKTLMDQIDSLLQDKTADLMKV